MNHEFLPEARGEFGEAALYYETREAGLGVRFRSEVAHVLERIAADPFLWPGTIGRLAKSKLSRFPYYVAYFIRTETTLIANVAHGTDNRAIGGNDFLPL